MIREGQVKKKKQAGKRKRKEDPPNPPLNKTEKVAKYDTFFECGVVGEGTSGISIFMIEIRLFIFSSNTWVFDTGYRTHICNLLHGFKKVRS
uniref:Uncharacterized protein n=1 Tax=Lactuca sativa TaxID=4236 RepID=A0A9R1ULE2_LACSA|nr:hypothetical protein LSAT_V11C800388920 [Lactuca sativa]